MTDNETQTTYVVDEAWTTLQRSPEVERAIMRMLKRGRVENPPSSLKSGAEYRAWCLSVLEMRAQSDETEEERESTRLWRARIITATEEELWTEYTR